MNLSPWPDIGKHWRFEWRKATWMLARPWYGANNVKFELNELTWLSPITFWFPFISVSYKYFHAYLGWKPIPPHLDPAFLFSKLDMFDGTGKTLYVQLSARWGVGAID